MPLADKDLLELHSLYARYGQLFDRGDVAGWLGLFTPDIVYTIKPVAPTERFPEPIVLEGHEALRGWILRGIEEYGGRVRHFMTNYVFDGDGDTARGSAYGLSLDCRGGTPVIRNSGLAEDVVVKRNGAWLFQSRTFTPDL